MAIQVKCPCPEPSQVSIRTTEDAVFVRFRTKDVARWFVMKVRDAVWYASANPMEHPTKAKHFCDIYEGYAVNAEKDLEIIFDGDFWKEWVQPNLTGINFTLTV